MKRFKNTIQNVIRKLLERDKSEILQVRPLRGNLSYDELDAFAKRIETPIKRYTKSELARMYMRTVQTFMKWVRNNKALMKDLERTGYKSSVKEFTKEQVLLIFAYLGEP